MKIYGTTFDLCWEDLNLHTCEGFTINCRVEIAPETAAVIPVHIDSTVGVIFNCELIDELESLDGGMIPVLVLAEDKQHGGLNAVYYVEEGQYSRPVFRKAEITESEEQWLRYLGILKIQNRDTCA